MSDSEIVISVENLWKEYRYGTISHATLRKDIQSWWARIRGKADPNIRIDFNQARSTKNQEPGTKDQSPDGSDRFWALRDISFEVKQGEVLGIIGKNGAGKSTLLKIMSRVTTPTRGQIKLKGRVASLLEVGTGFHPELTGRENIFLNGAILGMSKDEIKRKFDEIVAFAEIEKFIDTPVKRYSSGMYVRLAFAVAAHLEPEILLVDEVLAVGDAAFQKKCIGKMDDVAKEGRTVLFVSHNMGAVIQLCPSSVLINDGQIDAKGPSKDLVEKYLSGTIMGVDNQDLRKRPVQSGDSRLRFVAAHLQKGVGECTLAPIAGSPLEIVLDFESYQDLSHVKFMLTIYNQSEVAVTHCNVEASGERFRLTRGGGQIICYIPKLPLPLGQYRIAVAASDEMGQLDWVPTACIFDVKASKFFQTPFVPPMRYSAVLIEHSWELRLKKGQGS